MKRHPWSYSALVKKCSELARIKRDERLATYTEAGYMNKSDWNKLSNRGVSSKGLARGTRREWHEIVRLRAGE